jgi:hypothetical protein
MTPSEQLVFDLCSKSFLSLWSYANPLRPGGKELCDVLAVFGEHIVVFSVKEIVLPETETGPTEVAAERWSRKAIDESVKQLHGALRQLAVMTQVVRSDGSPGIPLANTDARQVHLVAVAAGGRRKVPFAGGVKDGQYVHVLDEFALREILGELNTAPDFIEYLLAKESFPGTIVCEGEENLLALYIHRGRKLPTEMKLLIVDGDLWTEVRAKPEFKARQEEDRISFWWDRLIELLAEGYDVPKESGPSLSEREIVVRTLAAENRFSRRFLSSAFVQWHLRKQAGARTIVSPSDASDVAYVFATCPRDWSREHRTCELQARCLVSRSPAVTGRRKVIGLGTEIYDPSGFSFDAVYFEKNDWTPEDEDLAKEVREKFGFLRDPICSRASADEFPDMKRKLRNKRKRERRRAR